MPKKSEGEVALSYDEKSLPVPIEDFAKDAGAGLEEATQQDIATPFLKVLQSKSPETEPMKGAYIEGAMAGDVMNGVTGQIWHAQQGEPIEVVHCAFRSEFVRWGIREKQKGFRGVHSIEEGEDLLKTCTRDEKSRDVLPGGEEHIQRTAMHYVLVSPEGDPAVIAMASTQLKKSRGWNAIMTQWRVNSPQGSIRPATYGRTYKLSTVPESNAKGDWYGWRIIPGPFVTGDLYQLGKNFHEVVSAGMARVIDVTPEGSDIPEPGEPTF